MKTKIKQLFTLVFCVIACSVLSQGSPNMLRLENLFSQAMEKDGVEYGRMREMINSSEGSLEFLSEKSQSTNVYERIIGRGMLSWRDNPATNIGYSNKIREHLSMLLSFHNAPNNVRYALYSNARDDFELKHNVLLRALLLEMVLKGITFENSRGGSDLIKCFAAGLAGNFDAPDIPVILEKLARESELDFMRSCALIGMSKTDSPNRVEILLEGLADESRIVREDASYRLMALTGQNLKENSEEYRILIQTNNIMEALPHLKAYTEAARQELESKHMMFEKSSIQYMITRDEVVLTVSPPRYYMPVTYLVTIDRKTGKAKGHKRK